jgi:lipoprotein-anchoring transpeptidase ErfK/SrfK
MSLSRRALILSAMTALALPAAAQTRYIPPGTVIANVSGFRMPDWREHFASRRDGMILVDTGSRCLFFWSEDLSAFRLYPCSVPIREEFTRRGRTSVVAKVEAPSWRPTAGMLKRNPDWPRYVPPGPGNPMGSHALYLGWPAFRIHGTHDDNKIGRRSSSGCFGLYNHHIAELFALVRVGTQVRVI